MLVENTSATIVTKRQLRIPGQMANVVILMCWSLGILCRTQCILEVPERKDGKAKNSYEKAQK